MPLFRRRRDTAPADADLPFLSVDQAQHLRALVSRSFAERGTEVVVHSDHVQDAGGRQFGLWNVAAACHGDPRGPRAWQTVVDEHVGTLLSAIDAPDPFEAMSAEELLARTYLRLYSEAGVPAPELYPHQEFAPGLLTMLALDLPDSVSLIGRDVVTRLGGWQAMSARGADNLRAEQIDAHEVLDGAAGGRFDVALGESVYTASLALVLPEIAEQWTGRRPGRHGWLLSVPNRHQLVWHLIEDAGVVGALQGMVRFAQLGFEDSPGPLSPHVYWWSGSGYQQLTFDDEDGNRAVRVEPDFQAVLEALTP